jgi:hypothetical protein
MQPKASLPGTSTKSGVVQLDMRTNPNGSVTITPADENRFALRMDDAIKACRLFVDEMHFRKRLDMVLGHLGAWVLSHAGKLRSAWLTVRDRQFLFVVVRSQVEYDGAFEDELTDLELQVANDADMAEVPLATLALPKLDEGSLDCFLDSGWILKFQGPTS